MVRRRPASQTAMIRTVRPQARRPVATAPPADTRRVRLRAFGASSRQVSVRRRTDDPPSVCACTFYLVFKEPDLLLPLPRTSCLGEPSNLTNAPRLCQPPAFSFFVARRPVEGPLLRPLQAPSLSSQRRNCLPITGACSSRGMVEPRRLALAEVRRTAPNPLNIRSQLPYCQALAIIARATSAARRLVGARKA